MLFFSGCVFLGFVWCSPLTASLFTIFWSHRQFRQRLDCWHMVCLLSTIRSVMGICVYCEIQKSFGFGYILKVFRRHSCRVGAAVWAWVHNFSWIYSEFFISTLLETQVSLLNLKFLSKINFDSKIFSNSRIPSLTYMDKIPKQPSIPTFLHLQPKTLLWNWNVHKWNQKFIHEQLRTQEKHINRSIITCVRCSSYVLDGHPRLVGH